jgi:endonuclease YncB( thermonuclease family)
MKAASAFGMAAATGIVCFALGVNFSGIFNQAASGRVAEPASPSAPQKMEYGGFVFGKPTNNDGDTLKFKGTKKEEDVRARLVSLDAPENKQACRVIGAQKVTEKQVPCGERAKAYLTALINGGEVFCRMWGKPTRDRVAVICKVGEQDIGREMVRAGWAVNEKEYGNLYASEEAEARREGRGIWGMKFEQPSHWRACNKPLPKGKIRPKDCGL